MYNCTGFEEFQAVEAISSVLEHHGFQVHKWYGGLQTAYRADKAGKGKGPNVAFLAEYDALRGIGHGCGHILIATCATPPHPIISNLLIFIPPVSFVLPGFFLFE